jgi:transketolase
LKRITDAAQLVSPPGNAAVWARMGIRAVYGMSLIELRRANTGVFAISADLGRSSGLGRFADEYPQSFLNVGIAEQLMVSVAAGIARSGRAVFASTFAPFATLRAGEFLRMELGYMQMPVAVIGLGSGLSLGFLGNSHYGLEDVGVVRSMAGISVYSPADASEMIVLLNSLVSDPHPCYVRLTGGPMSPPLYGGVEEVGSLEYRFVGRRGRKLIVSAGAASGEVSKALRGLDFDFETAKDVGFLHVNAIKPLPQDVIEMVYEASEVIVFDEHLAYGGLSSAIMDSVNSSGLRTPPLQSISLGLEFPEQKSYSGGLELACLSSEKMMSTLAEFIGLKR